jgi:hypothetical protein
MLRNGEISRTNETALRHALSNFADDINRIVAQPSLQLSSPANIYASAIVKGSNDKARRVDRHEALLKIMEPFVKSKRSTPKLQEALN